MNPVAGQHDPDETRALIEQRFTHEQLRYEIRELKKRGMHYVEGFDLVVVSGGDGTVMETMSGLMKSGSTVPLAQLPAGTANLLARALSIPTDQEEALDTVFTGTSIRLDVGYLPREDCYFALVVGAGYDARLIGDASRELKNILGFAAYLLTGIKNVFTLRSSRIELEIDGQHLRFRAHTLLIINVSVIQDANLALGPNIQHDDGKLDLMIVSSASFMGALNILFRVLTKRFDSTGGLRYMSASRIRITARSALPT
jgi:YegS/Rv2252/BmrU family lipid kinase